MNKTVDMRLSSIYIFDKTTSEGQKTIVESVYYDLMGRLVPERIVKGLLIRKSVYDDGSVGVDKVYIR